MSKNSCIVIPARVKSKRLPNKLLKKVLDKSIIEYTFKNVFKNKLKNNVILISSDTKFLEKLNLVSKK